MSTLPISQAFVGDSHAAKVHDFDEVKQMFENFYVDGVPGLPVWDIKLKEMLEYSSNTFDIVFWSCATELNGIRKYEEINEITSLPVSKRFIEFPVENDRYCLTEKYYHTITREQRELFLEKYFEQIDYFMNIYPNIVLVPLFSRFSLSLLPDNLKTPQTYDELLNRYTNKCINLEKISIDEPENFIDTQYHLSKKGFSILKNLFEEWVDKNSKFSVSP